MNRIKDKSHYLTLLRDCWITFSTEHRDETKKYIKSRSTSGMSTLEDIYEELLEEKYIIKNGLTPWDRRKNAYERRMETRRKRKLDADAKEREFIRKYKNMALGA